MPVSLLLVSLIFLYNYCMRLSVGHNRKVSRLLLLVMIAFLGAVTANADDGYRLWLRYDPLPAPSLETYRSQVSEIAVPGNSATAKAIRDELSAGLSGLLGRSVAVTREANRDGAVLVGTPNTSTQIQHLNLDAALRDQGPE